MTTAQTPGVGELLRAWRQRRNLSQLELSLESAISTRHLSFVETGRARPSREMVLHLAERLEVPLRERNSLLLAAGFAPLYGERPLNDVDMTPVREALDRFLGAHEPYPAVVVDGRWNMLGANGALRLLLAGVAPHLLGPPANVLRVALHPEGMAPRIANFAQWSSHLLHRLRRSAAVTADPELEALYAELRTYPGVESDSSGDGASGAEIVLPLRLRAGDEELTLLSTISTFGTATDVTLAELSVEAFYPADAQTASALSSAAGLSDTA
ncbi:MAG: helix-turn-helix transcriptional regulator [Actinomycetota bacterium]|nr:helix-turn-helix transcriptional regulator [Actinomycetota bacterium]